MLWKIPYSWKFYLFYCFICSCSTDQIMGAYILKLGSRSWLILNKNNCLGICGDDRNSLVVSQLCYSLQLSEAKQCEKQAQAHKVFF